ncbi:vWA domain-containing protein [Singulisphaera sp. PoT]|uniref:vWA domain-containing protein n=1 Tax=Singulisphaera sp. PoT TaxID=3411797 RepID=UPI003BF49697
MPRFREWLGRTPLTDPKSLVSSLAFHGVLIFAISLAAFSVSAPSTDTRSGSVRGELDPVDNREATEAGGSPGEIGGQGTLEVVPSANGTESPGLARDPAADALISEIIPNPSLPDPAPRALPGPQTSGIGVLPGPSAGGGGGSGTGSGGGVGRGVGPGTEFFGAKENAVSFAYVIDCSGSMATRNALNVAKRELLASLGHLPPSAHFAVVFYNLKATMLSDPNGNQGLMTASPGNKSRVKVQLDTILPDGGTDHMLALRAALALRPEVIFFLTDADLMTNTDASEILSEAGKTRIQAIEFGRGADLGGSGPLRRLANSTGGSYRYLDVTKFPKP